MKTFHSFNQEIITELLDKPYDYIGNANTSDIRFTTDKGITYTCVFNEHASMNTRVMNYIEDNYEGYDSDKTKVIEFFFYMNFPDDFEGDMDDVGITNVGDQFKVFSTIAEMIKRELPKMKPDVFYFSAKERSRRKLYQTMSKRLARKLDADVEIKVFRDEEYYIFLF